MTSLDDFHHVCHVDLEMRKGKIYEYMPQSRYDGVKSHKIHKHGNGPFCKFKIPSGYAEKRGVYLIVEGENVKYVGKCVNLERICSTGFGNISPTSCLMDGGQVTNCKINSWILARIKNGSKIEIRFLETADYINVRRIMIQKLTPELNDQKYSSKII